jgi:tripartite-type tricarboxylate transporter receptor subunit TctC
MVIQNIVGAGTATGSRAVYDAKPDGYTLLVHH